MQIELSEDELEIVGYLLQEHCRELHFEIAHTDNRQYKRSLKHRLEVLESVVARIQPTEASAHSVVVA